MAGDRIVVVPPSTSLAPALAPAVAPVTRSNVPLTVVPSWVDTPELVAAGSPRSKRPEVAVSAVPAVQPVAVSNVSDHTVVPVGGGVVVPCASVQTAYAMASELRLSAVSSTLLIVSQA